MYIAEGNIKTKHCNHAHMEAFGTWMRCLDCFRNIVQWDAGFGVHDKVELFRSDVQLESVSYPLEVE
jgi:hypothetical protein